MPRPPVFSIPSPPEPWATDARDASARLRVVPAFVPRPGGPADAADSRDDGLAPARGACNGLALAALFWLAVALAAWPWFRPLFPGCPG